jgi:CubicO group peptidase (beta-lactamase class C family)
LLRQTSGLNLPQNNSGADATTRIMYGGVHDKAAAAAAAPLAAPPGTRWSYSDTHYMLLSRLMRSAVGGRPGDLQRYAQTELFAPAGMHQVVMDTDASGTPLLSSHLLMPARDLARFGQLLLDDGVAQGRRLLPEGFTRRMATGTAANAYYGLGVYVAGDYTPRRGWAGPVRTPPAMQVLHSEPYLAADLYLFDGNGNQVMYIVPSEQLVILRTGTGPARPQEWDNSTLPNLVMRGIRRSPGEARPTPQSRAGAQTPKNR